MDIFVAIYNLTTSFDQLGPLLDISSIRHEITKSSMLYIDLKDISREIALQLSLHAEMYLVRRRFCMMTNAALPRHNNCFVHSSGIV
jgi:hypothetical protein